MTPVAIARLGAYREPHVIVPVKDWDDDIRLGYVLRCEHCHIRVYPKSPFNSQSALVHDRAEIKALAE